MNIIEQYLLDMRLDEVDKSSLKKIPNKELVNMHYRTHQLHSLHKKKHPINRSYLKFLIKTHDTIVKEMLDRNINHNSPLR